MTSKFNKVGLIGRKNRPEIADTLNAVHDFLKKSNIDTIVETNAASLINNLAFPTASKKEIGHECELAIVVGGDGSILHAARTLAAFNISVVGIHRGRLGFLTDIAPGEIEQKLTNILAGEYSTHELYLLHADITNKDGLKATLDAVNEVVINSGNITRMIEFEVYINDQFVYQQRSDGIIIATPTGSTAYALSGGGPILTPNLKALTLVPMFPHNLTSRSIVIPDQSRIKIKPVANNSLYPAISCDGQPIEQLNKEDTVEIYKSNKVLHLLHPSNYNYYETLRTKLHWGTKPV